MCLLITKKPIFILLFILLVFPCFGAAIREYYKPPEKIPENETEDKQGFAEQRPNILKNDEFTFVFPKTDTELDYRKSFLATEAQIYTGIYEGLFSYHPATLEPIPALAERWDLSDDKKQWTFTLRRNARFSNGDPVRAEDFRSAWLSLLEPYRESPYSGLFDIIEGAHDFRNGISKNEDSVGIIAKDTRTLIVKLNSPAAYFPAMLCHQSFSPIHHSIIEYENQNNRSPFENVNLIITNGPFMIERADSEKIVLIKNNYYWDNSRVKLQKITIKFVETAEEAAHLWNTGEARWIASDVDIDALTDRSGIQVNIMFATHYYFIRSDKSPWNDHRVRRALVLVLPWEEIRGNSYLPAETLIWPLNGYPEVKGITKPDYEEAKKLMNEAGCSDGSKLPQFVIRITPSREAQRVAALMADAWKGILNLNVKVEVVSYEDYYPSMKEAGYNAGSLTWIGDFADPYTFLQMWRRDSNLNDAGYDDIDFENLIDKSMYEEGEARYKTLAEAEKLLLDRGTVLPISFSSALNIIDTGEVDGWYANALDIHPLKYLSFKEYHTLPGVTLLTGNFTEIISQLEREW